MIKYSENSYNNFEEFANANAASLFENVNNDVDVIPVALNEVSTKYFSNEAQCYEIYNIKFQLSKRYSYEDVSKNGNTTTRKGWILRFDEENDYKRINDANQFQRAIIARANALNIEIPIDELPENVTTTNARQKPRPKKAQQITFENVNENNYTLFLIAQKVALRKIRNEANIFVVNIYKEICKKVQNKLQAQKQQHQAQQQQKQMKDMLAGLNPEQSAQMLALMAQMLAKK
jgi:hypothetical protein